MGVSDIVIDTNKVIQKVYHTDEMHKIIEDVIVSYINDTVLMDDEHLKYDRADWIKTFTTKMKDGSRIEDHIYAADVHTIAIEIEQLRRWGAIQYKKGMMTEDLLQNILRDIELMAKEKTEEGE